MKVEIIRIEPCLHQDTRSEIVAIFDALVGDFHVRRATLRQHYLDGSYFIGTGGGSTKQRAGITLPADSDTRAALVAAAREAYEWQRQA